MSAFQILDRIGLKRPTTEVRVDIDLMMAKKQDELVSYLPSISLTVGL